MTVNYIEGDSIVAITEPFKEGYSFSGWDEIPKIMPNEDIIIKGSFTINKYLLSYYVDDNIYFSDSIEYASIIQPIEEPTKVGYSFSGWSEIPETMPAHDVIISGFFTKNSGSCSEPVIKYQDGKLLFSCDTEGANFVYKITNEDVKEGSGSEIYLTATYHISVYATAPDHDNSETVVATLCWIDAVPNTEGIENGIAQVKAKAALIQSHDGTINIAGVADGTDITVYSSAGLMIGSAKASCSSISVPTGLRNGEIAIVKIGDKSVKIVMK